MKVLHLNHSDAGGGAGIAAYRLHIALQETGVESRMLVKDKSHEDYSVYTSSFFEDKGIKRLWNWGIKKISNKIHKWRWRKYKIEDGIFMSDPRFISLSKALSSIEYDILHLHWVSHQFLDLNELTKINKPIVWTLHDCWPFTGGCHYFYGCERYELKCGKCQFLNSTDKDDPTNYFWKKKHAVYKEINIHVIAPSKWLAKCAKKSTLFRHFPVSVIPNGIDTGIFRIIQNNDLKDKINYSSQKKYIAFGAVNATSDKNKGYYLLKSALTMLQDLSGSIIELLIFGSNEDVNLPGFIIHNFGFINDVEMMVKIYNLADVIIVPSISENLSCVIMESLACGTPVVAFNIGGNPDMIDHKENGYLALPYDCKDLAYGINWGLDIKHSKQFSIRKKIINDFDDNIISKAYKAYYKDIKGN